MKKFVSGLILAVVVTPALAENEVEQLGVAPSIINKVDAKKLGDNVSFKVDLK